MNTQALFSGVRQDSMFWAPGLRAHIPSSQLLAESIFFQGASRAYAAIIMFYTHTKKSLTIVPYKTLVFLKHNMNMK